MDNTDKKLLDIVQGKFPLAARPYDEMASLLEISEDDVISRLQKLKDDGIVRRIGAIFESKKLGYSSTLCAMRVPDERVDEVAQIINEYIGVTHNYLREHDYNIWFTITARSQQELQRIMAEIREKSGIQDLIDLPTVRMFKIRVHFSMSETGKDSRPRTQDSSQKKVSARPAAEVSSAEKSIVRELQGDLPLVQRPFKPIADKLGIEEEALVTKLQEMDDEGIIRRFSAILRHRNVGFSANAMGAWRVPEDRAEEVGTKMAKFSQVSHCYQRPTFPTWPYSLFTMIHGKTAEDCEQVAKLISQDTGIDDYRLLYSTREFKKVSMRYFTEED
ncbi:Lrp/AsnC family transcriptional regulator [Candidatus Poribacteria bacterium]